MEERCCSNRKLNYVTTNGKLIISSHKLSNQLEKKIGN